MQKQTGQQQIEPVHLLKAIISEAETIVNFIFQKMGANPGTVKMMLDKDIAALPKVSGGDVFLSRESNDAPAEGGGHLQKRWGDEYVSVESMLLGIFDSKSNASRILKDAGLDERG